MMDYTVLMAVYQKEDPKYFQTAIQSMLDQTVFPGQFVVVCDGPLTPALDGVIQEFQSHFPDLFQIVRLAKNRGLGIALQEGLKKCDCEIVARMDSDDISKPDRMERQLAVLRERQDVSVIGGQIAEFQGAPDQIVGRRIVPLGSDEIRRRAAFRNPMNHVTTVFRKRDILEVGNYQSLIGFEDYDLWARLLKEGKTLLNLNETVCLVRVSDGMYRRRGGLEYFKATVEMQRHLYACGLATGVQCVRNLLIRLLGACLPNWMRRTLFQLLMRKRKANEG